MKWQVYGVQLQVYSTVLQYSLQQIVATYIQATGNPMSELIHFCTVDSLFSTDQKSYSLHSALLLSQSVS